MLSSLRGSLALVVGTIAVSGGSARDKRWLKNAVHDGELTIVEAYYSLDTGEVTKLR